MQQYTFENITQEQLIEGVIGNDSKILQWIYQNNYFKVKQYILQNHGEEDLAKDIYQEAFMIFWLNVKKGKFHPQNITAIGGYLYQISKNKWLDYLRSSKFKKTTDLPELWDEGEDGDAGKEQIQYDLEAAFKKLGENCREILKRFYYQKESMEEISKSFGWTPATAKNNKYRCIQKLRNELDSKRE